MDDLRSGPGNGVEEAIQLNTERRQNLGNAQETISKMGGNLNQRVGWHLSCDEADGGLVNMMENYQAPPDEADFKETAVEGTQTSIRTPGCKTMRKWF